jgi:plasmid maintenance system antidote protein VapI
LKSYRAHSLRALAKPAASMMILLGFGIAMIGAKDLSAYHVGDVVSEDIVAPLALNVPDPAATANLKSAEAMKIPAIFRDWPGVTNAMAARFTLAFDTTRSNFLSALQETFHQTVLDHATITSPDFGYLLTAFNIDNKKFPIPDFLAMDWAYGKDGEIEESKWLNSLVQLMQHPIRPDDLPAGFELGDTLQLVPVGQPDQKLTPAAAQTLGQTIPSSSLATISQARAVFRREFTDNDELPLAWSLAGWLQPNCLPDAALTQTARNSSVRQIVVTEYYAAGQVIATKGSVVDQKIKAALDQLQETPATAVAAAAPLPEASEPPVALAIDRPKSEDQIKPPLTSEPVASQPVTGEPVSVPEPANHAEKKTSHLSYAAWLLPGTAFALAIIALGIGRMRLKRVGILETILVANDIEVELKNSRMLQTELAPQLVQIVRQAFVQELAGQRRDLLVAQQTAAAEVIRLVHRMDALQVAMQERLRTYEAQIQTLEAELTARTEENRQLIRLKIQMIRHQVETESGVKRIEFN